MIGLNYIKMPRSISEYTLMKGVTDFSNLKQFDLFESGYSFLTVVSVPKFMSLLAEKDERLKRMQDTFIHVAEGEFRGLSGLADITGDAGEINNGINTLNIINKVNMDTTITVNMSFYERSGSPLTNYVSYYLTGIKDPYSQAKTYHGLVGSAITDPGPDYEVFTFLYYVTDNTMRSIEKAYLLVDAQPTSVPISNMYDSEHGSYQFQEYQMSFNCFPIMGDRVNKYAAMMLQNDLTTTDPARMLILDSNDYNWDAYKSKVEGGFSMVKEIVTDSNIATTVANKMLRNDQVQLGGSTIENMSKNLRMEELASTQI